MKDRHLLLGAIVFAFSASAAHGQFAGESVDKSYQDGSAVFQMSIEGSGNSTQVWFSAIKHTGEGAAPEGQGTGKVTDKGKLEFKFEDSCKNSGTGTITKSGDDIIISVSPSRKADAGSVHVFRRVGCR
ncbi:MAG: hypothetical protein ACREFF_02790 [Candidatus Udaeobacter sp.]